MYCVLRTTTAKKMSIWHRGKWKNAACTGVSMLWKVRIETFSNSWNCYVSVFLYFWEHYSQGHTWTLTEQADLSLQTWCNTLTIHHGRIQNIFDNTCQYIVILLKEYIILHN